MQTGACSAADVVDLRILIHAKVRLWNQVPTERSGAPEHQIECGALSIQALTVDSHPVGLSGAA